MKFQQAFADVKNWARPLKGLVLVTASLVILGIVVACASDTDTFNAAPKTAPQRPPPLAVPPPHKMPSLGGQDTPPNVRGLIRPAPLPPSQDTDEASYARHPQVQTLAAQLAHTYLLDEDWVFAALSHARYNATVAKLIMPAATPAAKNWAVYRKRFVEPIRIRKGQAFWNTHQSTLQSAEKQYGVPANIIAGIIGVETIYGQQTGQFRVLDALSTLTVDFPAGRKDRRAFFKTQLGEFLRLCAEQHWDPRSVLGSYAGAMGWPQFMPSSIRAFAVDFDGDGQIDLNQSVPDVIGSVANFLAQHGWQTGMPTHFPVIAPPDSESLAYLLAPDIVPKFKVADMLTRGAALDVSGLNHRRLLALVKLENGEDEPTYIAGTDNFYTLTRYNNSSYYALSVIDLADAIADE